MVTLPWQLVEHMKECGYWQEHQMDQQSDRTNEALAKIHQFCVSEKHKETK